VLARERNSCGGARFELRRHGCTVTLAHEGQPVKDCSATTAALDLRGRARRRQPAGHLGAERHNPSLASPSFQNRVIDGRGRAVVADLFAEEAGADENLRHAIIVNWES
jgi:hypothetical protein